jgi:hypothetical protein
VKLSSHNSNSNHNHESRREMFYRPKKYILCDCRTTVIIMQYNGVEKGKTRQEKNVSGKKKGEESITLDLN